MGTSEIDLIFVENPDAVEERGSTFFEALGIPPTHYATAVLQPALAAVGAASVDPANRPWVPLGARNIGGRVRALVQDPTAPSTWYAGTGLGGVFKTTDNGDTWTPMGTPADAWPVGAMALAPSLTSVLYVGTGEVTGHAAGGVGFFRSHDGGVTFTSIAAPPPPVPVGGPVPPPARGEADFYHGIAVDPAHADRFWAASETGLWRFEPAGAELSPPPAAAPGAFVLEGLPGGVATDVVIAFDPEEPPPAVGARQFLLIYAAVQSIGVFRARFDRTAPGAVLVWTNLNAPFIAPIRIKLAVCATSPRFVYAVASTVAPPLAPPNTVPVEPVVRSEDGGTTWIPTAGPPDPVTGVASWALTIAVHPFRPRFVIVGSYGISRSTDGGTTWPDLLLDPAYYSAGDRSQHADQHAIVFDSAAPNRMWIANDGGIAVAADVRLPTSKGFWRKRSDGILAAQFNDITIHPQFPSIMGGGLQDNGTYVSFGGPSWYHILGGDGGMTAFEPTDLRTIYGTVQGGVGECGVRVVTTSAAGVVPLFPWFGLQPVIPEQTITSFFPVAAQLVAPPGGPPPPPLGVGPFVGKIELPAAGQLLVAQIGGAWLPAGLPGAPSPAAPVCPPPAGAFVPAVAEVSAVAFAPSAPAELWVGTDQGELWQFAQPPGGAAPVAFTNITATLPSPPHVAPVPGVNGALISRILIHPLDKNYVVVATAGTGLAGVAQGFIYLSMDCGLSWVDISGLTGAPLVLGAMPLPPCPVTSLAFDPTPVPPPAGPPPLPPPTETLYAGTLVGVFKLANLPAPRGGAAAAGPPPAFAINWLSFVNRTPADPNPDRHRDIQLPLTLVKDLAVATYQPTPGAAAVPALAYENTTRFKLRCATFGRGIYECDLDPNLANIPAERLFIRQDVIEDGMHYPRPTAITLNSPLAPPLSFAGDPRFPATPAPGAVLFARNQAYDIRIDSRDFAFFEHRVDGAEFDEQLGVDALVPAEPNVIYVQVHNRGISRVTAVAAHLYFAEVPAAAPPPAGAPDLQADFWPNFRAAVIPVPVPLPVAPAAFWQRIGVQDDIQAVRPGQPVVARFDWTPPASLAGRSVALLAVCEGGTDIIVAPFPPTDIPTLLANERRVALRVAQVGLLAHNVFIRDGIDDDGSLGSSAFGGRSPDIIVVQNVPPNPREAFRDLLDQRGGDVVSGSQDNFVYVRIFNPSAEPVTVDVELYTVHATEPLAAGVGGPPYNNLAWTRQLPELIPGTLDNASPTIPPNDWELARFKVNAGIGDPEPDPANAKPYRAVAIIALIQAQPAFDDPQPVRGRVTTIDTLWSFFRTLKDSNNAALRGIRFVL